MFDFLTTVRYSDILMARMQENMTRAIEGPVLRQVLETLAFIRAVPVEDLVEQAEQATLAGFEVDSLEAVTVLVGLSKSGFSLDDAAVARCDLTTLQELVTLAEELAPGGE